MADNDSAHNMNKKITIIVPVYNVENYLRRCVDSILNQTYKNLQIILVNDGSTDNSLQICEELKALDERIIVINKQNGGLSSARNAGLDVCDGDYISFIDSDDYIESDMIETLYLANENNGTKIACCGRFDVFDGTDKKSIGLCPQKSEVIDSCEGIRRILTWDNIDSAAWDKMYDKSLWASTRFPFGRISEDVAIMHCVFDESKTISLVSKPLYNYFHRANSITTSPFSEKSFDIIKNVEGMEKFVLEKYPSLTKVFLYFKTIEFCHLLSLMSKTKVKYRKEEKYLFDELRTCKAVLNRFSVKSRIRIFLFSHSFTFGVIRMLRSSKSR